MTQISIGVFIGSLAASAVVWGVFELRVRWELVQVERVFKVEAQKLQRQSEQARIAEQDRQQRDRLQRAEAQRMSEDAKRQLLAEAEMKESAWSRFYKPSTACAAAGQSVECSNEFIRAKRAFETQYRPGAL